MKNQSMRTNALLWAAVIFMSALLDAPAFFSQILMPVLAVLSLTNSGRNTCFKRGDLS